MKAIYNIVFLLGLTAFVACEKEENKVYFEGGIAPVLTGTTTAVRLEAGEEANLAIKLSWTNPDYMFTTGRSSQDVTYTLEIDTVGAKFKSPKRYLTVLTKDLSKTFTVAELNNILGNTMLLPLDPRRTFNLEARITSSLADTLKRESNILLFTARPFPPPPKVKLPPNNRLWIVGDATPGGWNGNIPTLMPSFQEFTRVSSTLYQLTLALPGGGRYKLLPSANGWGDSYRILTGTWNNGEFEQRDADPAFNGPPTSGTYKLTFDFQLGLYTLVKQ